VSEEIKGKLTCDNVATLYDLHISE